MASVHEDFWKGKRVLITGASGFVGRALGEKLASHGSIVTGVYRSVPGGAPPDYLDTSTNRVMFGDITDFEFVRSVVANSEAQVVFHLAASAIVRISARDPIMAYKTNVMGTVNVLEAIRNVSPKTAVVVASSDKAYGDHDILPYTEESPLQPSNTYDTSKACMDMISRSYSKNYGMNVCVTRSSNIYGPGDLNLSRLVPNTIIRLSQGKRPVLYSDIEKMQREFVYIDDVVKAYSLLGIEMFEDPELIKGDAFNIGGQGPQSLSDVARMICHLMGREDLQPEIIERGEFFREIDRQYLAANHLYGMTGWMPDFSLEEGLTRSISFYRELAREI